MTLKAIHPSEYYDQDSGGRIPVFRPTIEEFKDFYAFIESIDSYGKEAGIVKVIPPKEWINSLPTIDDKLELVRVQNPIVQHIMGSQGIYQQTNVEKRRPYTLGQWHSLCQEDDHKPPDLSMDRSKKPVTLNKKRRRLSLTNMDVDETNISPYENTRSKTKPNSTTTHLRSPPPSPDISKKTKREIQADEIALAQTHEPIPIDFDIHGHNEELYTDDYCKELERIYWRNLTFTQPMYGADMIGTLFDSSVKSWNMNSLDNILNQIGVTLPGVNTPYLYFGMWKATFPWHVEDLDLYSINYLHFGAPKQWYAIPGSYNKKFESVMQTTFFQQSKACPEFLRHKTHIASPKFLANNGIPVYKCVQHEGEFMITFPFGYHSGYNLGFNCAESVNFALKSWLDIGRKAHACTCINDSVTIDMDIFNAIPQSSPSSSSSSSPPSSSPSATTIKRPKLIITHNSRKALEEQPCVLCTSKELTDMNTLEGKRAHRLCAEAIPETYIDQLENGESVVCGIKNIPPARKKLACLYCHDKKGACIQCCYGKCCRSFHATCAKMAGATMIRHMDEKNSTLVYDAYCLQHDPATQAKKENEKQEYINSMIASLLPGKAVYVKWRGGGYYRGWITDCIKEKKSCRIKFEDGVSRLVSWKNIDLDIND
ncbi:JmjC domain, hydroxylase-domain-containing protein [Cunninghamella echinulata]|nr:JmjC domain, hydroxylase-domain-containing protein [Cunninghamella echinulata]